MWKLLRISLLLVLLVVVAGGAILDRLNTTDWDRTLWIGIFPINGDTSSASQRYIESLTPEAFVSIEAFFATEAARYQLPLADPVQVELYAPVARPPPALAPGANPIATAWWSLRLRWFAWREGRTEGRAPPHIRVFVLYHDPATSPAVPHSLGLQKGLVGVVHAFADRRMTGSNAVVIAHEVLHTLGATDKYDLETGEPAFPDGYGEPERRPRYPQRYAEIMGGRIVLGPGELEMPESLRKSLIGPLTAREINWVRN